MLHVVRTFATRCPFKDKRHDALQLSQ